MARLRGIGLELVAKPGDMLIDSARCHTVAVAPDLAHQNLTGDDVATRLDEVRQKVELPGSDR